MRVAGERDWEQVFFFFLPWLFPLSSELLCGFYRRGLSGKIDRGW